MHSLSLTILVKTLTCRIPTKVRGKEATIAIYSTTFYEVEIAFEISIYQSA